jgi:hypothetical protein
MILSHKHRFVFIKGLKVAGTSAEIALSQMCGERDIITPISPADERYRLGTSGEPRNYSHPELEAEYLRAVAEKPIGEVRLPKSPFYNHMTLVEVLERFPEAREYRLLFVERSPYEKVISLANWAKHRTAYDNGGALPRQENDIAREVDRTIADRSILKARNIDRYRDEAGKITSQGWRYETLAGQLEAFARSLGANIPGLVHAKRGLDTSRLPIGKTLRRDQIDFVNEMFADEFEAFGYGTA